MRIRLVNALIAAHDRALAWPRGRHAQRRQRPRLVAPGGRYDYDFEVRNRGGMYWYHPHPHGRPRHRLPRPLRRDPGRGRRRASAAPRARPHAGTHRNSAGAAGPARAAAATRPTPADLTHGFLGDEMFCQRHVLRLISTSPRGCIRLRILNACQRAHVAPRLSHGGGRARAVRAASAPTADCSPRRALRARRSSPRRSASTSSSTCATRRSAIPCAHGVARIRSDARGRRDVRTAPVDHRAMGHDVPAQPAAATPARTVMPRAGPKARRARSSSCASASASRYDRPVPARALARCPSIDATGANERAVAARIREGPLAHQRSRVRDGRGAHRGAARHRETWLLRNYHTSMPHAMHLHGFHFDVLARETSPGRDRRGSPIDAQRTARRRTRVARTPCSYGPANRCASRSTSARRFPARRSISFHCHNLEHEDGGMMLRRARRVRTRRTPAAGRRRTLRTSRCCAASRCSRDGDVAIDARLAREP